MWLPRHFKKAASLFMVNLLLTVSVLRLSNVTATVPEDMVPLNIYEAKETSFYPSFRGSISEGSSSKHLPMLHDFQGMKKIGRKCYVYARHNVFVIDMATPESKFNEIPYKQVLQWESSDKDESLCKKKGQTGEKCKSYIKIFEEDSGGENRVIVCSTNAFNPVCRFYGITEDGTLSPDWQHFPGSSWRCSYDPAKQVASLISDGNLYTGTETGFSARDAIVHRSSLVPRRRPNLRTSRGVATFLNEPSFVRFIDGGRSLNKVYAFFTETAIEDESYQIYSRVSQVCKNDNGGVNVLKYQFSSFFKARLNCSLPGQPPFYFNEIQAASDLLSLNRWYDVGNTKMIFTVMTTPRNSIPASAVCAFTLEDIEASLNGPFKEQFTRESTRKTYWDEQTSYPEPHLASCQGADRALSDTQLNFVRKHPLMHNSVPSWNLADSLASGHSAKPIFSRTRSRDFLTTIVVDTTAGLTSLHTVLIVGTENGTIIKILLLKGGSTTVIEERHIFNEEKCGQTDKSVLKIELDKATGTMMVAFRECIVKAPLCPVSSTCGRKCIESRDPYCGWDGNTCVMVDQLYVNKSRASESIKLRQDVVNGNVGGMPDCTKVVLAKGRSRLAGATAPPSWNTSEQFIGTNPVNEAIVPLAAAAFDPIVIYVLIGVVCLTLGCLFGIIICHLLQKSRKKYRSMDKKELANTYSKETTSNGYGSRHGSTNSNKKPRPSSSSSHQNQRNSNPRSSDHDENKRKRTTTENSVGSRSDEVAVIRQHSAEGHTPESPSARGISDTSNSGKHLNGSNMNGRRKARNSKPSTSSSPENNEEIVGNHQAREYHTDGRMVEHGHDHNTFADGVDLVKRGSTDSLYFHEDADAFTSMPPSCNKGSKSIPNRSMSFQDHHQSPMQRTSSMGTNGANTVATHRPHGRGINRQLSLQPNDLLSRQQMYQQTQQRGYPTQPPPQNMSSGRMTQPQVPVNATPNKNFDNRRMSDMTHSLDRRRKKGQNYQTVFSESVDEGYPIGASASLQPTRKRFVSESEKATRMARPNLYQPINEEQEPLMHPHQHENQPDLKLLRNNLSLKLNPAYTGVNNGQVIHSAPVMEPGSVISSPRRHPGNMVSHSNPGTPMGDHPPSFTDKGFPMGGPKGHTTLPSQRNHYVPQHTSLPEEAYHRIAFPAESPTKHASSPMQDGRPPSFPGNERLRHGSGPGYVMQGNRSPVKPNAPMPVGSPGHNHQLMNAQRTRYPSGGAGQNRNGQVMNEIHPESQPQTISSQMPSILQSSTIP